MFYEIKKSWAIIKISQYKWFEKHFSEFRREIICDSSDNRSLFLQTLETWSKKLYSRSSMTLKNWMYQKMKNDCLKFKSQSLLTQCLSCTEKKIKAFGFFLFIISRLCSNKNHISFELYHQQKPWILTTTLKNIGH